MLVLNMEAKNVSVKSFYLFMYPYYARLAGLQLSSQLLSDLKRASAINKTYKMRYSATEEELLQSLSNGSPVVPAQGTFD